MRKDSIIERRKIWSAIKELLKEHEEEGRIEQHDGYGLNNCGWDYMIKNILPKYGITLVD